MTADYTAQSITVLTPEQTAARWFWAKAAALAAEYKRPESWIERGLHACEQAGVPHDYFIDRYLKKLPLERHEGVDAALRDMQKRDRPGPRRVN